ncbi:MAG: hypothetical protein A2677_02470 [Candidatus Komeilibacteria bacterium RIFCSPHIGHO2_01_FULL_52_14]|uniref:Uncharacterized protein n=1 Tax=Candidatus Komeilibacteria bacterium RIFCSPHIGHO2_01_FULL_52_14 TaxID=1798549 RepID=A0A1G2BPH0_9BACT|nr:MAG: hypothetical protein A2677_02470 [Candidatus Komeilibacteria bacterium RIFCSPHIGHO2_01_FULL_52_14]
MFEDVKKQDDTALKSPGPIEDMFDKIDPAPQSQTALTSGRLQQTGAGGVPQPPQAPLSGVRIGPPQPLTNLSQLDEWTKSPRRRGGGRMFLILLVVVLLVGGGAAAYFLLLTPAPSVPALNANTNTNVTVEPDRNSPVDDVNANQNINTDLNSNTNTVPDASLIDSDGDGLSDVEEQTYGTDPHAVDSDSDGLSDRDELRVHKTNPLNGDTDNDALSDSDEIFTWHTNPNNSDTDGDTYLDGAEVQNGYDPNGLGRLIPTTTPVFPPQPEP